MISLLLHTKKMKKNKQILIYEEKKLNSEQNKCEKKHNRKI